MGKEQKESCKKGVRWSFWCSYHPAALVEFDDGIFMETVLILDNLFGCIN